MRLNLSKLVGVTLALAFCITFSANLSAQSLNPGVTRITQAVKESDRVTLKGNTHPLASVKNDVGLAPDTLPMERMLLVLKRSADQEASLKTLMEGQQSKTSPNFQKWLTPEQFGQQFGVSDSDIQTVTAWLQTHGFQVNRVAAGKMLIEFSGTAGQVRDAFQTQIHKYVVNGEQHWANASDPSIPSALAPVITGVNTLHNFGKKAMIRKGSAVTTSAAAATGTASPSVATGCPQGFATGLASNANCFGVGPADFAAIYNVPSTVGGAPAGTGQTIAIVGDSNICTGAPLPTGCTADDILNFRTLFGLPTGGPTNAPKVILDGPDPGLNGDEIEGDLDVEYSGAVAPNAQILFVTAANTSSANGVDLAAERVVDFNLAPVLNESFGECEACLGNAGNQFFVDLWAQAAAQGITVTVSAGDSGSASCDDGSDVAQNGLTVSGIASTPFNVAAGGTDFDFTAAGYPLSFWNTTSGANFRTAKGYITETTWNDSCAQSGLTGCNALTINSSAPPLGLSGGSGGQSNCVALDIFGDCTASYAKPTWQTGSGVPNDMVRDIPDISLFSSLGIQSGSFYIVCESDLGGNCVNGGSGFSFIPVGGTSAAAPEFAGIMALVNQNMVANSQSGRQGNANFVLYPMSAAQNESTCNSSSIPAANCVFNDVVKGNNSQPCVAGSFECSNTNVNSTVIGVLVTENNDTPFANGALGFSATSGYDPATGLGSVNVTNLVNGWPAAAGTFTPTSTTLTMTPLSTCAAGTPAGITSCISIVHGATVTSNITVTGGTTPNPITDTINRAEIASLIGTCQTATPNCFVGGSNTAGVDRFDAISGNADIYPLTNGSVTGATTNELIGGTYNVTAHYAGDGIHGASDSLTPIQVSVSPEGSTTTVTVFGNTSTTTATYGSIVTVRADIVGSSSGFETASGQVTLNDTASTPVVLSLNSDGHVEFQTPNIAFPGNNTPVTTVPALTVGAHSFSAAYVGDASYSASNSVTVPFTITQGPTLSTITTFPSTVPANTNFTLAATVSTASFGNAPTGTVSFFAGTTLLGSAPVVGVPAGNFATAGIATLTTAKISATASITATYSGDGNYLASPASAAVTVTATSGPTFTVSSASNPTVVAGNSGTSVITVAPTSGFTGTVALTCSVAPSNLTSTPTCSFNPTSVVLGVAQTSTLTVATTVTTTAQQYTVTVTGTSGATVVTTPVTLTVTAPVVPSFTVSSASNPTIVAANLGTSVITVAPVNGFTGTVALTCSVAPSNLISTPGCSFNPTSIVLGASQTSTMTVTTTTTTSASAYTVTITGTSGAKVITTTSTVTVTGSFSLTPAASSFTASAPGQSGTLSVSATATAGFPFTVSLSASAVGPATSFPPVCSFSAPISLTQAAPTGSSTLTCTTTAAGALFKPTTRPSNPRWLVPGSAAAATLAFAMFFLWIPSLRKRRGLVFAGMLLFVVGAVCVGCGGGGTTVAPNPGTAVGSYTVTVTATGGGASQTTTATFVLQ